MRLLKKHEGDIVRALSALYEDVQSKYPGYACCCIPKPDDEFYDAHVEYVTIRKLIHSLAKEGVT